MAIPVFQGLRLLLMGASLLLCVACSSKPETALQHVNINYGLPVFQASTAPLFSVPVAAGFWQQEGLEVEVQGAEGAGPSLQQLLAKHVLMTFTGVPGLLQLRGQGADIRAVASTYDSNPNYPVVKSDSPINDVADFKGKKIGVTSLASANVIWFKGLAASMGLNPETDVQFIATGGGAATVHALNSGRVDVLQSYDAAYVGLEARGLKLKRFDQLPFFKELTFVQAMIVRGESVKQDRKVLVGVLRGMAKGIVFAAANPRAAVEMHWRTYPASRPTNQNDATAMADAIRLVQAQLNTLKKAEVGRFGYVDLQDVARVRDLMAANGVIDQKLAADQYYTDELLAEANDFDRDAIIKLAHEYKLASTAKP